MFVYILIAAELALLYTVFWYLYLREPNQNRRIVGNTWGSYHPAATRHGIENSQLACEGGRVFAQTYLESAESSVAPDSAVKPFMLPVHDEMILDLKTNRYVPANRRGKTVLASVIKQLDDCLSELNVKA